jgi:hypothetical protein
MPLYLKIIFDAMERSGNGYKRFEVFMPVQGKAAYL